jgi:hypothetical protein
MSGIKQYHCSIFTVSPKEGDCAAPDKTSTQSTGRL